MDRQRVESTSIVTVGYDQDRLILEIEFSSGGVYQYLNVPSDVHATLLVAESKGRHVNSAIKGHFSFRRVLP